MAAPTALFQETDHLFSRQRLILKTSAIYLATFGSLLYTPTIGGIYVRITAMCHGGAKSYPRESLLKPKGQSLIAYMILGPKLEEHDAARRREEQLLALRRRW